MDQKLKKLLLDTLNPNELVRNTAEQQLGSMEKDPNLLMHILNVLMQDPQPTIQQISSLYIVNVLRKNWKSPEIASVVRELGSSIHRLLMVGARFPKQAYREILGLILDNSDDAARSALIERSVMCLQSSNDAEVHAALSIYEGLFKSDTLRYNMDEVLALLFNNHGQLFKDKFSEAIAKRNYQNAKMFMKVIARSYCYYSLPEHLMETTTFSDYFTLALSITAIPNENERTFGPFFGKFKKWAYFFLFKSTSKGLKKYFKSDNLIGFISSDATLSSLFTAFSAVIKEHALGTVPHPKIAILTCDFFSLIASNRTTKHTMKLTTMNMVGSFILPVQSYNDEIRNNFEYDTDNYLWERYNFVSVNLRTGTANLFTELMNIDKDTRREIVCNLREYLNRTTDPNQKYGVLGLFAISQKHMLSVLGKEAFSSFVETQVLSELYSPHQFMISQALYFLSLSDEVELSSTASMTTLKYVAETINSQHSVLSVEACLAMQYFLNNDNMRNSVEALVPALLERVLLFSKRHYLDSLNSLMDTIIDQFSEQVAAYAPVFAKALCENTLALFTKDDDNKVAAISGCLTTIEKLVMSADEKVEIVQKIYKTASGVIYTIFTTELEDFYQEAFDLMNTFLFSLQAVDQGMMDIFDKALSAKPDELSLYPREISDFIDNFLSYGRDGVVNPVSLLKIYGAVDIFIKSEDQGEDIYDEDFEAGCKIIDSLMLNAGAATHSLNCELIPMFIRKIVVNYKNFMDDTRYLDVYALESIMNCFLIAPAEVLRTMQNFLPVFFSETIKKHKKFKRVHDKKVYLLFIGQLFRLEATLDVDYMGLNEAFVDVFCSLPTAIRHRNKLRADDKYEEDYDDSQSIDESLEEDIWFETILDNFDAYDYTRNMLQQPLSQSIGQLAISKMTVAQVERIQAVLQEKQEQQK